MKTTLPRAREIEAHVFSTLADAVETRPRNLVQEAAHGSPTGAPPIASVQREGRMSGTIGVGLAIILTATALRTWMRSSSNDMTSTARAAVKASTTPMLPGEMTRNAGKYLPDTTPREPF